MSFAFAAAVRVTAPPPPAWTILPAGSVSVRPPVPSWHTINHPLAPLRAPRMFNARPPPRMVICANAYCCDQRSQLIVALSVNITFAGVGSDFGSTSTHHLPPPDVL